MLNHGVSLIVVSDRLGLAPPSITLDIYGHLIPNMGAEAAEKTDGLVAPVELHRSGGEGRRVENPLWSYLYCHPLVAEADDHDPTSYAIIRSRDLSIQAPWSGAAWRKPGCEYRALGSSASSTHDELGTLARWPPAMDSGSSMVIYLNGRSLRWRRAGALIPPKFLGDETDRWMFPLSATEWGPNRP